MTQLCNNTFVVQTEIAAFSRICHILYCLDIVFRSVPIQNHRAIRAEVITCESLPNCVKLIGFAYMMD